MGVCASESAPLLILFSFWQAHSSAVNGVVWVESEAGKSAIIAGACVFAGWCDVAGRCSIPTGLPSIGSRSTNAPARRIFGMCMCAEDI